MSEGLSDIRRGYAMGLMALSATTISFGGLLIRSVEEANVWQIALYRSIALFMAVALVMTLRHGRAAPLRIMAIGRTGLLGGALMAGATMSFLLSITSTTVANTLFMLSAVPFLTAGLAWLILGETLRRSTVVTMLAAVLGVTVMVAGGIGAGSLFGNVMGLACAFFYSGYAIVVRRRGGGMDVLPYLMVSSALVIALALTQSWADLGIPLRDMAICFIIGAVLSGGANLLFMLAARHLAAAELTLFTLLEIALGPFWVWLFIAEVPRISTLLGGFIVIGAVLVRALTEMERGRRRRAAGRAGGFGA
jgi:drug/metabolite transporter (DMT)-like permease